MYRNIPTRNNRHEYFNNADDEQIKKLTFCLDHVKNKKLRFESHKEFLEKCLKNKLTPDGLKCNLEPLLANNTKNSSQNGITFKRDA